MYVSENIWSNPRLGKVKLKIKWPGYGIPKEKILTLNSKLVLFQSPEMFWATLHCVLLHKRSSIYNLQNVCKTPQKLNFSEIYHIKHPSSVQYSNHILITRCNKTFLEIEKGLTWNLMSISFLSEFHNNEYDRPIFFF
jgi:hypothetical protein